MGHRAGTRPDALSGSSFHTLAVACHSIAAHNNRARSEKPEVAAVSNNELIIFHTVNCSDRAKVAENQGNVD